MLPQPGDKVWVDLIKNPNKFGIDDFLLRIFIFVVRKAYDNHRITLSQAAEELYKFFSHYQDIYPIEKILNPSSDASK